ncbi:hypothetical protein OC861_002477 [Tilletia horrida]|nr:hypothetical protein OC861_002477 [Tilletia horrida]
MAKRRVESIEPAAASNGAYTGVHVKLTLRNNDIVGVLNGSTEPRRSKNARGSGQRRLIYTALPMEGTCFQPYLLSTGTEADIHARRAALLVKLADLEENIASELEGSTVHLPKEDWRKLLRQRITQSLSDRQTPTCSIKLRRTRVLANESDLLPSDFALSFMADQCPQIHGRLPGVRMGLVGTTYDGPRDPKFPPSLPRLAANDPLQTSPAAWAMAAIGKYVFQHPEAQDKDVWTFIHSITQPHDLVAWPVPSWTWPLDRTIKFDFGQVTIAGVRAAQREETDAVVGSIVEAHPFDRFDWSSAESQIQECANFIKEALWAAGLKVLPPSVASEFQKRVDSTPSSGRRSANRQVGHFAAYDARRTPSTSIFSRQDRSNITSRSGYGQAAIQEWPPSEHIEAFCRDPDGHHPTVLAIFQEMPAALDTFRALHSSPAETWSRLRSLLIFFSPSVDLQTKHAAALDADGRALVLTHNTNSTELLPWGLNQGKRGKSLLRLELIALAAVINGSIPGSPGKNRALHRIEALLDVICPVDVLFDIGGSADQETLDLARAVLNLTYEPQNDPSGSRAAAGLMLNGKMEDRATSSHAWPPTLDAQSMAKTKKYNLSGRTEELAEHTRSQALPKVLEGTSKGQTKVLLTAYPDLKRLLPAGKLDDIAALIWILILFFTFNCDWVIIITIIVSTDPFADSIMLDSPTLRAARFQIRIQNIVIVIIMVFFGVLLHYNNVDRFTGLRVGWYPAHHPLRISVAHRQHGYAGGLLDAPFGLSPDVILKLASKPHRDLLRAEMLAIGRQTNVAIEALATNMFRASHPDEVLMAFLNHQHVRRLLFEKARLLGIMEPEVESAVQANLVQHLSL